MSDNDQRAKYLESGPDRGDAAVGQLDAVRELLADEVIWDQPAPELGLRIARAVSGSPNPTNWWMWAAVGLALVLATIGLTNAFEDDSRQRREPAATVIMAGTELAAGAAGTADLIPTPNGWAIAFEVEGLPPAELGTFYQAWVSNGSQSVSVGSFHMRGEEPTPIALWSGVDLHDYRTIDITREVEGNGPESSGVVVMTGSTPSFN